MPHRTILVVDDEAQARISLAATLERLGVGTVVTADGVAAARHELTHRHFHAVLLDLRLRDGAGEELLDELAAFRPELPVIVVSGADEVTTAVRCMRAHAADYLVKPVTAPALESALRHTLERSALEHENRTLARLGNSTSLRRPEDFHGLITVDMEVHRLMLYAEVVAPSDAAVLITGEPGSGKRLMAHAIHALSDRIGQCITVTAADGDQLQDRVFIVDGALQQASHGTLVIELGCDLDDGLQLKLMRLLRDHEYFLPGSDRPNRSTARIILTTSRDTVAWVRDGGLRRDLYYHLRAHHLHLPPLRERRGDIPLLVHHLVAETAQRLGLATPAVTPSVLRAAQGNPWPGNIRELAATVEQALAQGQGQSLDAALFGQPPVTHPPVLAFPNPLPTLDDMRDQLVAEALRRTNGDLVEASRLLGMTRWGLSKRLKSQAATRRSDPS